VNMSGHSPGGTSPTQGFSTLLAVSGPMARSAEDLEAGLGILAGPEVPDSKAMHWTLPPARHASLRNFRVGYVLDDAAVPVSAETKAVLESAVRACEKAGARVVEGWPAGFVFEQAIQTYLFLLGAFNFSMMPPEVQQRVRPHLETQPDPLAKGSVSSFAEWQGQNLRRLGFRGLWEKFFESFDVFLSPVMFTAAIQHDHGEMSQRLVTEDGIAHPYRDLIKYVVPASLTGCPATAAPVGLSKSELPVGIQIMGPYLEDATPIAFARLLAREIGGFQAPPGYAT